MAATKHKQPNVFDTRVIQRNVGDGSISEDEVKAHMKNLPDAAPKAEPFETSLRGFERDDDDLDEQD